MKFIPLALLLMSILNLRVYAQKPPISLEVLKNWKELGPAIITNDGKFGCYSVIKNSRQFLFIKKVNQDWELEFPDAKNPVFTNDNKKLLFQFGNDSILFFDFKTRSVIKKIAGTKLQTLKIDDNSNFIAWVENEGFGNQSLVLWNETTNKYCRIAGGFNCWTDASRKQIIILVKALNDQFQLKQFDVELESSRLIWQGYKIPENVIFSRTSNKIAFVIHSENSSNSDFIVYYGNYSERLNHLSSVDFLNKFKISGNFLKFNYSDTKLYFGVSSIDTTVDLKQLKGAASVDVWHYKDVKLQSQQLYDLNNESYESSMTGCVDFASGKVVVLDSGKNEYFDRSLIDGSDIYAVLFKGFQRPDELQLRPGDGYKKVLVVRNLISGVEKEITPNGYYTGISVSPENRFVLYFDQVLKKMFCFDLSTNRTIDISLAMPFPLYDVERDKENPPLALPSSKGIWSSSGKKILIGDQFDIWEIDPNKLSNSRCITAGFGRRNNVWLTVFQIANNRRPYYRTTDDLLIRGLDRDNYSEGFLIKKVVSSSKFHIDLYPYKNWNVFQYGKFYLVQRSSKSTAVNWTMSSDLKRFSQFTNINPRMSCNWYTKELVNYRTLTGKISKGILYKPEDFDSTKKYPIIFNFYEVLSPKLHDFEKPRLSQGPIDPAWMCSRGYLVFQLDISFKFGSPGDCAFQSIVGAARHMIKNSWVDSTKMGLSGASFGASSIYSTVTRTGIFAAAAAACGITDQISAYNAIRLAGISQQYVAETTQSRMGVSLWEDVNLFIQNSPILKANNVTTPMLIQHNKQDDAAPFTQGLEWYLGLRRLGKPVWLLQYDGEGHGVQKSEANKIDYTKRLEQFFGYYLKGDYPPVWMTKGIPAMKKMKEQGFSYDSTNIP